MALSRAQNIAHDDPFHRLMAAGRDLLKRGETKFGIAQLCAHAGVNVAEFHALFSDRRDFLEQLIGQKESKQESKRELTAEQRINIIEERLSALEKSLDGAGTSRRGNIRRDAIRTVRKKARRIAARLNRRAPLAAMAMFLMLSGAGIFAWSMRDDASAGGNKLETLLSGAQKGDTHAQTELAFAYVAGKIAPHDAQAAARWAMLAAAQDNADAQYLIGSLLLSGDGIAADPKKAVEWFEKSAAQGNLKAMHNLAIAYVQGRGTAKDPAAAANWFARAASQGYVDSAFDLAVLYEQGLGVKQDPVQALHWYRKAAAAGDRAAASRAHFLATDGRP